MDYRYHLLINCGMYRCGVKMVVFSFRFSEREIKGVMSRWLQHPWHPGPVGQLGATDTSDDNVSRDLLGRETPPCQPSRSWRPSWPRSSFCPPAWRSSPHRPHSRHSQFSGHYSTPSLRYCNALSVLYCCCLVQFEAILLFEWFPGWTSYCQ